MNSGRRARKKKTDKVNSGWRTSENADFHTFPMDSAPGSAKKNICNVPLEDHREPTLRNKKQVMCLSADDREIKNK